MTIYDIARKLKVSPTTVSMALNDDSRVALKTRTRVKAYAVKNDFTVNESAKNFRLKKSALVAVVVYRIDTDFWSGVIRAVEQRLGDSHSVVVCNSDGDLAKERRIVDTLRQRRIEGLIIQPASGDDISHLSEVARSGIPTVLFEKTAARGLSFVKGDDYGAARNAVGLFAKRGLTGIAMLTFKTSVIGNADRLAGFKDEIEALGLRDSCQMFDVGDEFRENIKTAFIPSAKKFNAILCVDDKLVSSLLKELRLLGRRVPEDVSILSWNDSPFLNYLEPSVSSIAIPVNEMGARAASSILAYYAGDRTLLRELLPEAISYRESFPKTKQEENVL